LIEVKWEQLIVLAAIAVSKARHRHHEQIMSYCLCMVFLYLCTKLLCWMVGLSDCCKPFPGHITLVVSVWLIGFLVWSVFALKIVRGLVSLIDVPLYRGREELNKKNFGYFD
jgi:hypothetical protein